MVAKCRAAGANPRRFFWGIGAVLALGVMMTAATNGARAEGRPMTLDDFFQLKRASDVRIHPDGGKVAYSLSTPNLADNKSATTIFTQTVAGKSEQVTTSGKRDRGARWSPDGKLIVFESGRSGSNQLWLLAGSGEARQLTDIAAGVANPVWSRDGKKIAFVSSVWPEYSSLPFAESNAKNKKRMDDQEKNPVKAKVFTKLFYRHWDEYVEDRRQHLFIIELESVLAGGAMPTPKDLTPGDRDAYPTSSTFSVGDDFSFSPDGSHVVFTAVPKEDEAWNTRHELCRVPVTGGSTDWQGLKTVSTGAENAPLFSPDGKLLAYRAQRRPGYEADKWELWVAPANADGTLAGQPKCLTLGLDRSVDSMVWKNDTTLLFLAEEDASAALFEISAGNEPKKLLSGMGQMNTLSIDRAGKTLAVMHARMNMPPAPALIDLSATPLQPKRLATGNEELLGKLDLPAPESLRVPVEGAMMQMWLLKPPGFDPAKKWPMVYLVHGGPQGAWEDGWSWRWNPSIWAARGYVVACPNPRGSTGFGQKFVDEISGDWGGKCYADLMSGLAVVEKLPGVDTSRMASAGASFGGYMMNWFQGSTKKFKTLITHCGVYNFDSMYATTEELWFDEWEHGGPPWGKNRASYEKHSPHRLAANFSTPMLIIHNDLDFRVPVSEGHQLFTTLQRLKVPSKFINFPDEGHWVVKPKNSEYWHNEVFGWLEKYTPAGPR